MHVRQAGDRFGQNLQAQMGHVFMARFPPSVTALDVKQRHGKRRQCYAMRPGTLKLLWNLAAVAMETANF
jgi:hypothetical protein